MTEAALETWINPDGDIVVGFPNGAIPHQVIAAAKAINGYLENEGLTFRVGVQDIIQHREFRYVEAEVYSDEEWPGTRVHGLAGGGRVPVWILSTDALIAAAEAAQEDDE